MKSILLSCLAGLVMIIMGLFPNTEYVIIIGFTIVGLSFLQSTNMNRLEALSMISMGISGIMMFLGYNWWIYLPGIAGCLLILSTFESEKDAFSILKIIIGVCWAYTLNGPSWVIFLAGGLMIFIGLAYIFVDRYTDDLEFGT